MDHGKWLKYWNCAQITKKLGAYLLKCREEGWRLWHKLTTTVVWVQLRFVWIRSPKSVCMEKDAKVKSIIKTLQTYWLCTLYAYEPSDIHVLEERMSAELNMKHVSCTVIHNLRTGVMTVCTYTLFRLNNHQSYWEWTRLWVISVVASLTVTLRKRIVTVHFMEPCPRWEHVVHLINIKSNIYTFVCNVRSLRM